VQFAPFYVGLEGIQFSRYGLDVSLDHKSESDVVTLVASGEADFGIVSGEQVLLARAQGLPVVYVFDWYQKYPIAIASRMEDGIKTPADLKGHTVGVPMQQGASYIGLEAILASAGLTDSDIDLQVTGFTQVDTLATHKVDAVVVYANNEPVQFAAQNIPVNLIMASDQAALVSNGLIVSEKMLAEHPDRVRAMVAGLSESLQAVIDDPDAAFTASQKYVEGLNDPAIEAAQREVLARSIDLWKADRLGATDPAAWDSMAALLIKMGLLDNADSVKGAFSNEYLP
jgi:NitT/TauT family transport system substrate-binding protein